MLLLFVIIIEKVIIGQNFFRIKFAVTNFNVLRYYVLQYVVVWFGYSLLISALIIISVVGDFRVKLFHKRLLVAKITRDRQ